jgi:hypothetical protein
MQLPPVQPGFGPSFLSQALMLTPDWPPRMPWMFEGIVA